MYREYVRKWSLFKRNRIICPEVAVNGQFLPGKSKFVFDICLENKIFFNCLKKLKFIGNLPGTIEMFFTRLHDPQISNQIDAVVHGRNTAKYGTERKTQSV